MEISKVLEGFATNDTLTINAQVQVIRWVEIDTHCSGISLHLRCPCSGGCRKQLLDAGLSGTQDVFGQAGRMLHLDIG